jgi:hypothetical protein
MGEQMKKRDLIILAVACFAYYEYGDLTENLPAKIQAAFAAAAYGAALALWLVTGGKIDE